MDAPRSMDQSCASRVLQAQWLPLGGFHPARGTSASMLQRTGVSLPISTLYLNKVKFRETKGLLKVKSKQVKARPDSSVHQGDFDKEPPLWKPRTVAGHKTGAVPR